MRAALAPRGVQASSSAANSDPFPRMRPHDGHYAATWCDGSWLRARQPLAWKLWRMMVCWHLTGRMVEDSDQPRQLAFSNFDINETGMRAVVKTPPGLGHVGQE